MPYVLALLGGLFSAGTLGVSSAPFGLVVGYLLGALIQQGQRLLRLENEVIELREDQSLLVAAIAKYRESLKESTEQELSSERSETPVEERVQEAQISNATDELDDLNFELTLPDDDLNELDQQASKPKPESPAPQHNTDEWAEPLPEGAASLFDTLEERVKSYFTSGNLIVRVGVIVLFFGVAFLLKFAADNSMLPIEFRLAGVAAGGIAMLILGWRLKLQQQGYALALQGGAIGVLYLTVFAALRLYTLIPPTLAFALLLVFVAFSALLALLQNSRALAVLATAGGFLAPVLTSTGEGSHVSLFSYYLLLNGGVLAIAWFRSWRILNLVGFGFTFVIGSLWGYQYYRPEFFTSTEPFLVAFFLLYAAVAVLFALRQPPNLKGIVDGTLVFGVPLVTAGLQASLVKDFEFGLAFSAIAMGGFYIVLAMLLFRRAGSDLRLLSESFLATGIVFATLAIPFALEGRLSAAFWALEGAAMVWVGIRQNRMIPRLFGCALQLLAALFYVDDSYRIELGLPILNGLFLGAVLIAFAGLFSSFYIDRHREKVHTLEKWLPPLLFVWGAIWWLASVIQEIDDFASDLNPWAWLVAMLALTGLVAELLKTRLNWDRLRWASLALLPGLACVAAGVTLDQAHPLVGWGAVSWLFALIVQYGILRRYDDYQNSWFRLWHGGSYWLLTLLLTVEAVWRLDQLVAGSPTWEAIPLGLVPMLMMLFLLTLARRLPWPVERYYELYSFQVVLPLAGFALVWAMFANIVYPGSAWPLQYLPVLNPLDLTLLFSLLLLVMWWQRSEEAISAQGITRRHYFSMLGGALFLILNGMVVRAVHHWGSVPFDGHSLFASQALQASIAVLWGSIGLICMLSGSRLKYRILWMVGAGMMGLVVAKLFLVDLSNTGTVARIISFMGVGLLLLVVGYFSPAPPRNPIEEESGL